MLKIVLTERMMNDAVEPHVSDMQYEYFVALHARSRVDMMLARMRGYCFLSCALLRPLIRWAALAAAPWAVDALQRLIGN
jgi:hypothetical protein